VNETNDNWSSGNPYEYFMGRWSKLMAPRFLQWIGFNSGKSWLDLGCGTGALSEAIVRDYKPSLVLCVDPSAEFLSKASERNLQHTEFQVGSSSSIPASDSSFDIVVSGLALNFFPDLKEAFSEMKRVLKPGGTLAAYVWDYSDRMEFLRVFWDTATEIDQKAIQLDEGNRFPICNLDKLKDTFLAEGLSNVETASLDIETVFKDFNDYWNPFLGGQGPAPGYLASLNDEMRNQLQSSINKKLKVEHDGSIKMIARALAIKAIS